IFNRAAEEVSGHQAGYMVGEPLSVVFPEEARDRITATLRTERECLREESALRHPDGSLVPVSLTTSLLRDERRQVYGAIATVTHPKKLSPRRSDAREILERSLHSVHSLLVEKNVRVEWIVPQSVPTVLMDPDQMQQVFINLVKNATEASPFAGRLGLRLSVG